MSMNSIYNPAIIGFHGGKGGTGRTTTMIFCAMELARQGWKVLMVDADFEAPTLDIILRVHPEMENMRSDAGIDCMLQPGFRQDKAYLENTCVNVVEKWQQESTEAWVNTHDALDRQAQDYGLNRFADEFSEEMDEGALWLLPCSRENNLDINYLGDNRGAKEVPQRLRDVVLTCGQLKNVDIILVDCRNGNSDAAAIALPLCHMAFHTLLPKWAHVYMFRDSGIWYTEKLGMGNPTFAVYTHDPFAKTKTSDYEKVSGKLKAQKLAMAQAYNKSQREALGGHKPKATSFPVLRSLAISDFAVYAFPEVKKPAAELADHLYKYAKSNARSSKVWSLLAERARELGVGS